MKIVYLHQYFSTPHEGGGTRSYEFSRRWGAEGHEVHVLRAGSHVRRGRWDQTTIEGISVHTLGLEYSNRMSFSRRLAAFSGYALRAGSRVLDLEPDVVYATSTPLTVAVPALQARRRGIPYVFEVRDLWPDVPVAMGYLGNPVLRAAAYRLEATAYWRSTRIVALAPGMRDDIVAKGVPGSKVSVIPQGCDTELFNSADPSRVRAEHPWVGEGPMVLYAGTVGEANGLAYLIDLADHMRAVMPEVRFAIVGDGKERDALEARAASLGMKDKNIFFIGRVPKTVVVDWMAASQATLALLAGPRVMWKDAVQNKFFDSVAAGKPIVTNNGGWQTSIALEEGLGVTLSPDDLGLAAEQLSAMLRDEEFLGRVPANARRVAETRFNRDRQAREALRILEAAVASST